MIKLNVTIKYTIILLRKKVDNLIPASAYNKLFKLKLLAIYLNIVRLR